MKDERSVGIGELSTKEGEGSTLAFPFPCERFNVHIAGPRPAWCEPCAHFRHDGRGYLCALQLYDVKRPGSARCTVCGVACKPHPEGKAVVCSLACMKTAEVIAAAHAGKFDSSPGEDSNLRASVRTPVSIGASMRTNMPTGQSATAAPGGADSNLPPPPSPVDRCTCPRCLRDGLTGQAAFCAVRVSSYDPRPVYACQRCGLRFAVVFLDGEEEVRRA